MRYRQHEKPSALVTAPTTTQPHGTDGGNCCPEALKEHCEVVLSTDSQYVRQGITSGSTTGKRGWKTAEKKPVKNVDLLAAVGRRKVSMGFNGNG
ncbi:hypothetical protein MJ561_06120 [Klebsiella pneumoniae]|nr:hypothetical protein MJ561_06120 [Klebsiella pneumoniae]